MAVAADAVAPARAAVVEQRKDAVAEVRFRARAKARHGAARGERRHLARQEMRRMHQAPASVDGAVFEQPLDRPLAELQRALLDLACLLQLLQRSRIHRAQRMRRHPRFDVFAQAGLEARDQVQHRAVIALEPGLPCR